MTKGAGRFRKEAKKLGIQAEIFCLPQPTRTAFEAAEAINCRVGQIAKSIIFKTASGKPILVVASGASRIDEKKLSRLLGEEIFKADANFVHRVTGFAIGGVPPFAHLKPIKTFLDKDLFTFSEVWAAAGDQFSVFKTTPQFLQKVSHGEVVAIAQEKL
ncbi:YbaK/EbsC family protein [Candidatus Shapirobacteria bacterium]|nr:YbaK/EbsC family protein [Candidatus Shapirobacteria bacterium]